VKPRFSTAAATLAAAALAASTLLATAGTAHAVDTATITVNVVDQFGEPAPVAIELFDAGGNGHYDGPPGAPPIMSTHVFTGMAAGGYGVQSLGPWSGVECFGLSPCTPIASPTVTPVLTVADGGAATYTAHVTMPTVSGGPAVGSPLSIQTSAGYQLLQALAIAQTSVQGSPTQQWLRTGSDIPGATGPTYMTLPADGGQQLAARLSPSPSVMVVFAQAGYAVPPYPTRPVAIAKNATKTKVSFAHGAIRVKVKSTRGAVPDGKINLSLGGLKFKAKLKKGKVTVAVPKKLQPGTYTLKVKYLGSTSYEKSKSKKLKITVH
jgi:hypothetical protein